MFLLTFSFANFETTRERRGKAKKLLLNFQNLQVKKRGETFFGECICSVYTVLAQCILQSVVCQQCTSSLYCRYTAYPAVYLQCTLLGTAGILHFGLGCQANCKLQFGTAHDTESEVA